MGRASACECPRTGTGEHRGRGVALRHKTRRVCEDIAGVGDWAGGLALTVCVPDPREREGETLANTLRCVGPKREDLEALD